MTDKINVFGISGSLRKGSFNAMLLRTARSMAPDGMSIDIYQGLGEIQPYNDDVKNAGFPANVQALMDQIRAADAVLIVTPEYNYSIPGVLKNAIDWASRGDPQPFKNKPILLMGAAGGVLGTARAQYDLRRCFIFLEGLVMNRPEVFVGAAHTKFAEDGSLKDEPTATIVKQTLGAFADWVKKVG
jgi:chromate reductase